MAETQDIFRPRSDPARSIYDAFQKAAKGREGRSVEEWDAAEINAVYETACRLAPAHGMKAPTREQVAAAHTYALGSVDFGATWTYAVVRRMQPTVVSPGHA